MNKAEILQNQAKRMGFNIDSKECKNILLRLEKEKPKTFDEIKKIVAEATNNKVN